MVWNGWTSIKMLYLQIAVRSWILSTGSWKCFDILLVKMSRNPALEFTPPTSTTPPAPSPGVRSRYNTTGALPGYCEGPGERGSPRWKLSRLHVWSHQRWENIHLPRSVLLTWIGFKIYYESVLFVFFTSVITILHVLVHAVATFRSRGRRWPTASLSGHHLQQHQRTWFSRHEHQTPALPRVCEVVSGAADRGGAFQEDPPQTA